MGLAFSIIFIFVGVIYYSIRIMSDRSTTKRDVRLYERHVEKIGEWSNSLTDEELEFRIRQYIKNDRESAKKDYIRLVGIKYPLEEYGYAGAHDGNFKKHDQIIVENQALFRILLAEYGKIPKLDLLVDHNILPMSLLDLRIKQVAFLKVWDSILKDHGVQQPMMVGDYYPPCNGIRPVGVDKENAIIIQHFNPTVFSSPDYGKRYFWKNYEI